MKTMKSLFMAGLAGVVFAASAGSAMANAPIVGLITKTNTNPFFVKMREGAKDRAEALGVQLLTYSGKYDGDNEAQVEAVESLIAAGAKGILITPSDTKAIVPTIQKARDAGILVIAIDAPLAASVTAMLCLPSISSPPCLSTPPAAFAWRC